MKLRAKYCQLRTEAKKERVERDQLTTALRYYADRGNYEWSLATRAIPIMHEDGGRRAREVLKKISKGEGR